MKRLTGYFLQGLVYLIPLAFTVYAFFWAFRIVDGWLGLPIPGLGLIVTLAGITGIGFLTGAVTSVSIWLLETFPALQNFG